MLFIDKSSSTILDIHIHVYRNSWKALLVFVQIHSSRYLRSRDSSINFTMIVFAHWHCISSIVCISVLFANYVSLCHKLHTLWSHINESILRNIAALSHWIADLIDCLNNKTEFKMTIKQSQNEFSFNKPKQTKKTV